MQKIDLNNKVIEDMVKESDLMMYKDKAKHYEEENKMKENQWDFPLYFILSNKRASLRF